MASNPIAATVTAHAWNRDHTQLAVAPNSHQVQIYQAKGEDASKWKVIHTLEGHFMLVTGIDWNDTTNMIATSGQDRNAYVWKLEGKEWKPTLVILRIGRAATSIKWSPNGTKFAVGSGSKQIPVCHYEESQDMWVARTIKKGPKSTVCCVDWSPNNIFLIAGGSDFKCRIYSGFIKDCGDSADAIDSSFVSAWGDGCSSFGSILAEFDQSRGWVEACRFAPSGTRFAFCGHDSTVNFGEVGADLQTILRRDLPLRCITFLTDELAVGAGYDNVPIVYEFKSGRWEERGPLDTGKSASAAPQKKKGAFQGAFAKFNSSAKYGGKTESSMLPSRHQNVINGLAAQSATVFTTCGADGRVLFWDMKKKY